MPPLLILLLAALLAAPLQAGSETIRFELDGLKREMILTIPEGLEGPVPLVLATHGLLETAESMQIRLARHRYDALAEQHGFVVAYPSAYLRVWNIAEGVGAERIVPQRDDVAYMRRVIDEVRARVEIDPDRIFAAGFSQGGILSFALACKHPGLIRAVASVAMSLPQLLDDDCGGHPPDGVQLIHGTDDPIVPFDGGRVLSGPGAWMFLKSHDDTAAFFAAVKGCALPTPERVWDEKDDGTVARRIAWDNCVSGRVEAWTVEGMGHRWPMGGPFEPVIGPTTREIDGAATTWGFFSRFQ